MVEMPEIAENHISLSLMLKPRNFGKIMLKISQLELSQTHYISHFATTMITVVELWLHAPPL